MEGNRINRLFNAVAFGVICYLLMAILSRLNEIAVILLPELIEK